MSGKRLEGKVVLVTGAAQGIGQAVASMCHDEGAFVVLSDINDALGNAVTSEIGERCIYLHLDVQKEDDWKHVMEVIFKQYGMLDVLVNNAGVTGFQEGFGPQDPEHASLESWHKVHAINLDGVFLGCKYAIGIMKQARQGAIVNISSRSGLVGIPGAAAYASSKAGVRNHTKTVALYCCQMGYNIRCNSVHPAAILTPMWDPMLGTGSDRQLHIDTIVKDIPMHKMGEALDVASAVLFLATDESKYITGVELTVDGGILAGSSASPKQHE